jgi:hypothetical protein
MEKRLTENIVRLPINVLLPLNLRFPYLSPIMAAELSPNAIGNIPEAITYGRSGNNKARKLKEME